MAYTTLIMNKSTKELVFYCLKKLGLTGYSGVIVSASNSHQALDKLLRNLFMTDSSPQKQKVYRVLVRQKLIQIDKEGRSFRLTITPMGAYRLSKESLDRVTVPYMTKWDGKWRFVSYDLPATKKSERYELTRQLSRMGFSRLQNSMWVHPYACAKQVGAVTTSLSIARYVTLLEANEVDTSTSDKLHKLYPSLR